MGCGSPFSQFESLLATKIHCNRTRFASLVHRKTYEMVRRMVWYGFLVESVSQLVPGSYGGEWLWTVPRVSSRCA